MDAETFKRLFLPYHRKLYRIAFRFLENEADAEDLLQDVYLQLWERRKDLSVIANAEAYCCTLVKNRCLDKLKSVRHYVSESISGRDEAPEEFTPEERLEAKDELRCVEGLMERLPEPQQTVMQLRHINDCTMEEIEQVTGLNAVNIRVLLSRGRKNYGNNFKK